MEIEALTELLTVISNLPAGSAPAWNPGMARVYQIGLRQLPDAAAGMLAETIVDNCRFRPTVHEIKDIWRQLTGPASVSPADIVAALSGYVQKYGAYGQPHPTLKHSRVLGPLPEMTPDEAAVVACWGGWEHYANDESPVGVKRGQALKVAQMVVSGGTSEDMNRLRLEYREQQAALPVAVIDSDDAPLGLPSDAGTDAGRTRD